MDACFVDAKECCSSIGCNCDTASLEVTPNSRDRNQRGAGKFLCDVLVMPVRLFALNLQGGIVFAVQPRRSRTMARQAIEVLAASQAGVPSSPARIAASGALLRSHLHAKVPTWC